MKAAQCIKKNMIPKRLITKKNFFRAKNETFSKEEKLGAQIFIFFIKILYEVSKLLGVTLNMSCSSPTLLMVLARDMVSLW